jgi:hypothetical protein
MKGIMIPTVKESIPQLFLKSKQVNLRRDYRLKHLKIRNIMSLVCLSHPMEKPSLEVA